MKIWYVERRVAGYFGDPFSDSVRCIGPFRDENAAKDYAEKWNKLVSNMTTYTAVSHEVTQKSEAPSERE